MSVRVDVVRVFTTAGGALGNPLGIAHADAVAAADRQRLAAELGFSETVFVSPPVNDVASVDIFTPARRLPFAGHPTVGTAWWLARQQTPVRALDVPAGEVTVTYTDELTWVRAHADWTPEFVFHEFATAAEVEALDPGVYTSGHHYAWAWTDASTIRSRMFAPDLGIAEDQATGAAAVRITAKLGVSLTITQGQGCRLLTRHEDGGWVSLGGQVAAGNPLEVSL